MKKQEEIKEERYVPINPFDLLFMYIAILVVWLGVGSLAVVWIGGKLGLGFFIISLVVIYIKFIQCENFLKEQASHLNKGER